MRHRFAVTLTISSVLLFGSLRLDAKGVAIAAPASQDKPVPACGLLTPDEIKRAGRAVRVAMPPSGEPLSGGGSECEYAGDVAVQLDAYPVSGFEAARKRFEARGKTTFTALTGVGDQAYYYEQDANPLKTVGIFTRAGSHVITVSMGADPKASADANRTVLMALAKTVLTKVGR